MCWKIDGTEYDNIIAVIHKRMSLQMYIPSSIELTIICYMV